MQLGMSPALKNTGISQPVTGRAVKKIGRIKRLEFSILQLVDQALKFAAAKNYHHKHARSIG
jgi:hypothetical protein